MTVLELFERSKDVYPNKVAVKDIDEEFTYNELYENAVLIGAGLKKSVNTRNTPIIVYFDKGCKCLASMLGVLYSGNCYVPMDTKTPGDRMKSICDTIGEEVIIITSETMVDSLQNLDVNKTFVTYESLITGNVDEAKQITREVRKTIVDTDLMYLLFTSGSTGTPKGVAIMHRSVVDYINAFVVDVGMSSDDIIGNQTPFYADMSLKDIYITLSVGATLCIIPAKYFMTPKKCMQYLEDNKVTYIMWVPTAYRIMYQFNALEKVRPSYLKTCIFSGEVMPIPVYRYWKTNYPEARFVQLYGPTEITGACTYYFVTGNYSDSDMIPIGKAFVNTEIMLVDDEGNVIGKDDTGSIGEILVGGTCLAAGYYNSPEKTSEKFIQNPNITTHPSLVYTTGDLAQWDQNGNLIFHTRKDFQIKHAGRRIELGEIETAAQSVELVNACCCVHNKKEDRIVMYYIGDIDIKELGKELRLKVPQYMVPERLEKCDELPMLPSGKLDRAKLDKRANE